MQSLGFIMVEEGDRKKRERDRMNMNYDRARSEMLFYWFEAGTKGCYPNVSSIEKLKEH